MAQNRNLSTDQFHSTDENGGWGSLPAHYSDSASQRRSREDSDFRSARHAEWLQQESYTGGAKNKEETGEYKTHHKGLNYGAVMRERAVSSRPSS